MPARQDSWESHVKYHLQKHKWQKGVCGDVLGVRICLCVSVYFEMCAFAGAYLCLVMKVHWQRVMCRDDVREKGEKAGQAANYLSMMQQEGEKQPLLL